VEGGVPGKDTYLPTMVHPCIPGYMPSCHCL